MKKIYLGILLALLCTTIISCGKIENTSIVNSSDNLSSNNQAEAQKPSDSPQINNNEMQPIESEKPSNDTNIETTSKVQNEISNTPTPKTIMGQLSASQQYSDINKTIKVIGLKEYSKIEGESNTDKAKKGKKFLVLFLSIRNDTYEDYYMNYNYLSAKVDGKDVEHTFLLNDPRNYPTIFTHIESGKTVGGFIVWEVPKNWKTFKVTYDGWKDIDNISIKATFKPEDLFNPPIYDAMDYE